MTSPWRLLHDLEPRGGAWNMAADAALLEAVRDGAPPAVRLYRWDPPTLSFGRNQPAAGLYDENAARDRGIAFVRRPTGGQAVLHADELTYAVVAPVARIGRPREAYRRINHALVAGLRCLGVEAGVAGAREGVRAGAGTGGGAHTDPHTGPGSINWAVACFRDPAEGEVVVAGRKLVGSAQRCEGRVVLQHGSILVSGSQAAAEELLRAAPPPAPGWTTLADELVASPSPAGVAEAILAGFEEVLGTALARATLSVEETARARELRATFASREWTWRR